MLRYIVFALSVAAVTQTQADAISRARAQLQSADRLDIINEYQERQNFHDYIENSCATAFYPSLKEVYYNARDPVVFRQYLALKNPHLTPERYLTGAIPIFDELMMEDSRLLESIERKITENARLVEQLQSQVSGQDDQEFFAHQKRINREAAKSGQNRADAHAIRQRMKCLGHFAYTLCNTYSSPELDMVCANKNPIYLDIFQ